MNVVGGDRGTKVHSEQVQSSSMLEIDMGDEGEEKVEGVMEGEEEGDDAGDAEIHSSGCVVSSNAVRTRWSSKGAEMAPDDWNGEKPPFEGWLRELTYTSSLECEKEATNVLACPCVHFQPCRDRFHLRGSG